MKASYHNGRKNLKEGNANHNDRNFDVTRAPQIDPSLSHLNRYLCVYPGMKFHDAELRFYKENIKPWIDRKNQKRKEQRHKKRMETIEQAYRNKRTQPSELILQIGNGKEHPDDPTDLMECYNELMEYSDKLTNHHCKVLDAALHMDEPGMGPHMHVRCVWLYAEDGVMKIGQGRALEQAGIPLPEPYLLDETGAPVLDQDGHKIPQKPSQYNNRKMTYDRLMRKKWYDVVEGHGYVIDRTPSGATHVSMAAYKARKAEQERQKNRSREQEEKR